MHAKNRHEQAVSTKQATSCEFDTDSTEYVALTLQRRAIQANDNPEYAVTNKHATLCEFDTDSY